MFPKDEKLEKKWPRRINRQLNVHVGNVILADCTSVAADDRAARLTAPMIPHACRIKAHATFQKCPFVNKSRQVESRYASAPTKLYELKCANE